MTPAHYAWMGIITLAAVVDIALALSVFPTLSQVVWLASRAHPVVAFLAGFLAGHLFWRG